MRTVLVAILAFALSCGGTALAQFAGGIPISPGGGGGTATVGPAVVQHCSAQVLAGTSVTCTFGSTPGVGSTLYFAISWNSGSSNALTPPGTVVATPIVSNVTAVGASQNVYQGTAGASAATTYAFTQVNSANMTVQGVEVSNGYTYLAGTTETNSVTTINTPTIVPVGYQTLPLAFYTFGGNANNSATPAAGWTDQGSQFVSGGPSIEGQSGPLSNPPAGVTGSVTIGASNSIAATLVLVGSAYSPPFPFYDVNGLVANAAGERVSVGNIAFSCTSGSLCSIGTYNFRSPWAATPTCVFGPTGASAASTGYIPVVTAVSTTSVTVSGLAVQIFSGVNVTARGVCFPT